MLMQYFKKGKKTDASNYRPISLTVSASEVATLRRYTNLFIIIKMLESIIRDKVIDHLEKYELINNNLNMVLSKRNLA